MLLNGAARAALGEGFDPAALHALGEVALPGLRNPVPVFALAVPPGNT